jgi:PAS domain S-box-containing protein
MRRASSLFNPLQPPYSLRTVLMLALTALALFMVAVNGLVSYQRIDRETLEKARQQADSLAQLVASTNTEAMILNDIGAIESSLLQVTRLPGASSIAVIRSDGRRLAEVRREGGQFRSSVGGTEALPAPAADGSIPARILAEDYQAWASIGVAQRTPLGWVRVDYSLSQRRLEQEQLWQGAAYTLLATIAAILTILPLILNWALRPLQQLSTIAGSLSSQIGRQVVIDSSSLEANTLAQALNKASHDVAEEVARTQVIVNTAAVAIISLDVRGHVISANPATTSIFGVEEGDLLGQSLEQCIPGLGSGTLHELFGELENTAGRVYRIVRQDFFGIRLGGTFFPIEVTLGQAPQGSALHYVCIVRDITDERAALETSELYERALASSHNGVFITNAKVASQPIIFINEAFQKITGLGPHQVLGRSMDLLRNDQRSEPGLRELQLAVLEQRNTSITLLHELPNGRQLNAEVSLSPVRSAEGTLTNFIGIVSDVTARVRAEQAIAERSAQLDAIFSLSPDGFVLFDANGEMMFANPAFERMTCLQWKQDGRQMTQAELETSLAELCHPDHPLPALDGQDDDLTPWQARLVLTRPQHRVVQAQSRRNIAGRGETILYFRDVTHEDEVDRMKSEFLASAAHELRTPMVSIFGFTELLLKRQFTDERRADMLATIHRQSGLLVKMINELLDLARIESRRGLDLHIDQHPLSELVQNSVKGLMRKDNERQVSIHRLPDVPVLIDPEKMQLALSNLLSNAFKYSPQGGEVTLSARVTVQKDREYAVLEVSDRGIGMTPEQLACAFERFYRADTTGNIPGTGLGLSLVKEVAELHNGHVELESELGRGTQARLYIPMPSGTAIS